MTSVAKMTASSVSHVPAPARAPYSTPPHRGAPVLEPALDCITAFLKYVCVERRMSAHTLDSYRRDLECIVSFCALNEIADWLDLNSEAVRKFAASEFRRGQSP